MQVKGMFALDENPRDRCQRTRRGSAALSKETSRDLQQNLLTPERELNHEDFLPVNTALTSDFTACKRRCSTHDSPTY